MITAALVLFLLVALGGLDPVGVAIIRGLAGAWIVVSSRWYDVAIFCEFRTLDGLKRRSGVFLTLSIAISLDACSLNCCYITES